LFTRPLLFGLVFVLTVSSIYSVSAQSDNENTIKEEREKGFSQLDDALTPQISATLTGLSLTGGTFLVSLIRNTSETFSDHIQIARKSFIKAFLMFLICTIAIFVFDFLEIIDVKNAAPYIFFDVILSYALFGIGASYLVNAAKHLFNTYGKL
jgi:hypothetical protein